MRSINLRGSITVSIFYYQPLDIAAFLVKLCPDIISAYRPQHCLLVSDKWGMGVCGGGGGGGGGGEGGGGAGGSGERVYILSALVNMYLSKLMLQ